MAEQIELIPSEVSSGLRDILKRRVPVLRDDPEISDDLRLLEGGLELDSIALVEIIFACEDHFKIALSDEFLKNPHLKIRDIASQIYSALKTSGRA